VKATTSFDVNSQPYFLTDPSTSLIGGYANNVWASTSLNQRFHIDLGSVTVVNKIYYENYHNQGASTSYGVKDFTLW
jgi:hypothetical protein